MALCLLGKEPLDTLQSMAVELFSPVSNKALDTIQWQEHPYGSEQLKRRVDIVPIKDLRGMHVCFPMPDMRPWYLSSPGQYLSHLIGHEGKVSLVGCLGIFVITDTRRGLRVSEARRRVRG